MASIPLSSSTHSVAHRRAQDALCGGAIGSPTSGAHTGRSFPRGRARGVRHCPNDSLMSPEPAREIAHAYAAAMVRTRARPRTGRVPTPLRGCSAVDGKCDAVVRRTGSKRLMAADAQVGSRGLEPPQSISMTLRRSRGSLSQPCRAQSGGHVGAAHECSLSEIPHGSRRFGLKRNSAQAAHCRSPSYIYSVSRRPNMAVPTRTIVAPSAWRFEIVGHAHRKRIECMAFGREPFS